MTTFICVLILVYLLKGRKIDGLVDRLKDVDWHEQTNKVYIKLQQYSIKYGRKASKPLLELYYVLSDPNTPAIDKAMIYAAIIYTVSPATLISRAKWGLFGILDEGVAILFVYDKVRDKITPETEGKVRSTLNEWFGVEYEPVDR